MVTRRGRLARARKATPAQFGWFIAGIVLAPVCAFGLAANIAVGYLGGCLAWAAALLLAVSWVRSIGAGYRRDPLELRAELVRAAARLGHDEMWLARDDHVVLSARRRRGRLATVAVYEEDDLAAFRCGEPGAFVSVLYITGRTDTAVHRWVHGVRTVPDPAGGVRVADGRRRGWRGRWDLLRTGYLIGRRQSDASPDELRALIRQIRCAERIDG